MRGAAAAFYIDVAGNDACEINQSWDAGRANGAATRCAAPGVNVAKMNLIITDN